VRTPLNVGVVGLDARGVEYATALSELPQVRLTWLCEEHGDLRHRTARRFATARMSNDPGDLLEDEALDAMVIVSGSRPELVWRALAADKHVLAAPPLARSQREAADLVNMAQTRDRALVVSEPLVAQPAATKLKELIETERLGDLYALYANRHGLPRARPDDDGIWSFGVDEMALLLYLLGDEPIEVLAHGESYVESDVIDVAFCCFRFATGISAHLHLSWLDPLPVRRLTAVGSKRMAVLDDLEPVRKLTIYQHLEAGIGDVRSPRIDPQDTVRQECQRLISAARATAPDPASRRAVAVLDLLETVHACLSRDTNFSAPVVHAPPELRIVPAPSA
jgi:predicted dehydrogenase